MFEYIIERKLRMHVISRYAHVLISGNISTVHLNQPISRMQLGCKEPFALANFSVVL